MGVYKVTGITLALLYLSHTTRFSVNRFSSIRFTKIVERELVETELGKEKWRICLKREEETHSLHKPSTIEG